MKTLIEVSAYGQQFIIECNSDQEYYEVRNVIHRNWWSHKVVDFVVDFEGVGDSVLQRLSLPLIYAKDWLKDYPII